MQAELGFIGLGAMGGPMARRLLEHGHELHVHDLDATAVAAAVALGARAAASPAEVADRATIVLVSLPTPDVVRHVALGTRGLVHGSGMAIYVDVSTTGARAAREVAIALADRGVVALDAPVSGGVAGARAGTLAVMAAGDLAAFRRVEPVLRVIGHKTTWVGPEVGQGHMLKLVNNLLAATTFAAALEAFALGARAGLDPARMAEVINNSSGRSLATERLIPEAVLTRAFDFGFRLELMAKDVRLCLEEAAALDHAMPTAAAAQELWMAAMERGDGASDFTVLARLIEERAGVTLESQGSQESQDGHD